MTPRDNKLCVALEADQELVTDITTDRLPEPILDSLSELHWNEIEASDPR